MSPTDRQLLFAVLALQLEFITAQQFAEICTVWATRKNRTLAELLADRGWLNKQDHSDIERLLTRKIERHGGDLGATLREAGRDERVKGSLANIPDETIHRSLMPTPPPHGLALVATRAFVPDGSERYTLSHVHRTGGIGRVWLAHDVTLRREVALKELRPDRSSNEAMWTMFLREARITGQLEHPGIVPIYEVGQRPDDKGPFYTMRFIRGQTLAEAAEQYHSRFNKGEAGPLELRKLLSAIVGVCNAVAYAHSRGVLHRDLKPQNVVLGAFGEVIVLDWGLARLKGEPEPGPPPMDLGSKDGLESTRQGHVVGTPAYMSPEQAEGRLDILGTPTDVYGLGAVLYHILTNEPPFSGATAEEIQEKVIRDPVPPLRQRAPGVPPALEAVCLKALSKKPEDRYESATALADEVQHWLADEPVQAYPEPVSVRASRWARRHKTFVTSAAVFMAVSAVALAAASTMIWREQQAMDRQLARTFGLIEKVMKNADEKLTSADVIPVRRTLIEAGNDTMNEILAERPHDPQVAAMSATLDRYYSTVLGLQGEYAKAEAELRESIGKLEPLVAKFANDDAHITSLAQAHFSLGATLKSMGRRREAIEQHEKAIRLTEGPASKGNPDARFNLAIAVNELSICQFGHQPMEVTEKTALRAADLFRKVIIDRQEGDTLRIKLFLSSSLVRIANCRRELNRAESGLPMIEESKRIMKEVGVSNPRVTDVIHFRALAWIGCARTTAAIPNRLDEAMDAYDQAIGIWEAMGKSRLDRYAVQLAAAYARRADLHRQAKRTKKAEYDLSKAEAMLATLGPGARGSMDYSYSIALAAAGRVRLAKDAKDSTAVQTHLAAAREAYRKFLHLDPENDLERRSLENLEAEVK